MTTSYSVRRPYFHIDVLGSEVEDLRKGFVKDAPTIGKLKAGNRESTAHILFARPLVIGVAWSSLGNAENAEFYPRSPTMQDLSTTCVLLDKNEDVDYALLKCEEIEGASLRLNAAFPKISEKASSHFLSFNTDQGEKVLGTGIPSAADLGGFTTDEVGSNHIIQVITGAGLIPVTDPKLHRLYDRHIWPLATLYFRNMKQHYFTYFRQYEIEQELKPSGNDNRLNVTRINSARAMTIRSALRRTYQRIVAFLSPPPIN